MQNQPPLVEIGLTDLPKPGWATIFYVPAAKVFRAILSSWKTFLWSLVWEAHKYGLLETCYWDSFASAMFLSNPKHALKIFYDLRILPIISQFVLRLLESIRLSSYIWFMFCRGWRFCWIRPCPMGNFKFRNCNCFSNFTADAYTDYVKIGKVGTSRLSNRKSQLFPKFVNFVLSIRTYFST